MRYQTNFAKLLDERLPKYAKIDWDQLAAEIGVNSRTLRYWYEASVGSENYLSDYKRTTADKIMDYLNVHDINDLIVRVDNSPRLNQEKASAVLRA